MANHPFVRSQQSRFDRLLSQQCLVRRFRVEHESDYLALRAVRDELIGVLTDAGVGKPIPLFENDLAPVLGACFRLAETAEGRKALRNGELEAIEVGLGRVRSNLPLPEGALAAISEVLSSHVDRIAALIARYNYFDYCGLLSMTSLCDGSVLCRAYDHAASTRSPPLFEDWFSTGDIPDEPSFRWFHVLEDLQDIDLACSLKASVGPERFTSPSIQIFDSRAHSFPKLDNPGARALYLRIGLERAPADIDHALRYFRAAVEELLLEQHGAMANVPQLENYRSSQFATAAPAAASLFEQKSELQGAILGLWCWDLTRHADLSIEKATLFISDERERWQVSGTPGSKSIAKHLTKVSEMIRLPCDHSPGASALDRSITREAGVRLGPRAQAGSPT